MKEHFTPRLAEKNRGLEFCCDLCNRQFDGHLDGHFDWLYYRVNLDDEHPYSFWCLACSLNFITNEGDFE